VKGAVTDRSPISARSLLRLASEQRELEGEKERTLAVAGARRPAAALGRELAEGADSGSIVGEDELEEAEALVYLLGARPRSEDRSRLRKAAKARVPVICVRIGGKPEPLPGVLATDIVSVEVGEPAPVEEVARALARRLEARSVLLAARIPALRAAICDELIGRSARRSAAIAAAAFVKGPDLPALFLEQARLTLRLGYAHGRRLEPRRGAEMTALLAAGLGLRKVARRVRNETVFPAWALQGSIAYAGTLALGRAAVRYFSELG
jgi:uncharacterized protein (DUF697 family)